MLSRWCEDRQPQAVSLQARLHAVAGLVYCAPAAREDLCGGTTVVPVMLCQAPVAIASEHVQGWPGKALLAIKCQLFSNSNNALVVCSCHVIKSADV